MADKRHENGFDRPRVLVAASLSGLVILLSVLDVFSADYHLSEVTLAALLGTVATLLGVEIVDVIRGTRDD